MFTIVIASLLTKLQFALMMVHVRSQGHELYTTMSLLDYSPIRFRPFSNFVKIAATVDYILSGFRQGVSRNIVPDDHTTDNIQFIAVRWTRYGEILT